MNVFERENNSGSQINPDSQISTNSRINHDSRINPDSQINPESRINSPIQPTFNIPLTRPTENTPLTQPTDNIPLTQPKENIPLTRPTEFQRKIKKSTYYMTQTHNHYCQNRHQRKINAIRRKIPGKTRKMTRQTHHRATILIRPMKVITDASDVRRRSIE